jgi:hypothetical protein
MTHFHRGRRSTALLAGVAAAAACAATLTPPAQAAPAEGSNERPVIGGGLITPLSLDVQRNGAVLVSQNFAGQLLRKPPGRAPRVIARANGEIGAVSVADGVVTYAVSRGDNEVGLIRTIRNGRNRLLADLGAFERRANPDRVVTYGFLNLGDACRAQLDGPARYRGVRETHPYATTSNRGTTFVADAGANAIFAIGPRGRVRAVAPLPGVVAPVSEATAQQRGFPACAVGKRYRFESVPTDVEVGPGGWLYVSTLGGQDDGSPISKIYKINPSNGRTIQVAGGLVTATGLAVARDRTMYVAELFAGRITRIAPNGRRSTFQRQPLPGDVEVRDGRVYATVNVLPAGEDTPPNGKVLSWRR